MDGIFRTYLNKIEYGAIEVAKKYDQTKLLADGFKLSKAMHDNFYKQKMITDTMKIVLIPQEAYEFYRELVGQKPQTDELEVPWSLDSIR
ncbi:hypothetical protein C2G38_2241628 [Gigaspora rosea]|uniref:Uncharacterized protein n=1 Tax=Gigaspora rosea TaxID=44941 RepID=A0A397VYG2_9GLOM|nr:hypothetical protein C2G38_2241628 [Gigaspora rosea]